MRSRYLVSVFVLITLAILSVTQNSLAREFLTDEEIKRIQMAQEIDKRVKIYMEAAEYRLKAAQDRLSGVESVEGDPLEFFTPEDMVDGYYQIISSVMLNLDGAYQEPTPDLNKIKGGLKSLRKATDKADKQLEILKKIAEANKKEALWTLVKKAMDITEGAHEGAVYGLEKISEISERNQKRRR